MPRILRVRLITVPGIRGSYARITENHENAHSPVNPQGQELPYGSGDGAPVAPGQNLPPADGITRDDMYFPYQNHNVGTAPFKPLGPPGCSSTRGPRLPGGGGFGGGGPANLRSSSL